MHESPQHGSCVSLSPGTSCHFHFALSTSESGNFDIRTGARDDGGSKRGILKGKIEEKDGL